MSRRFVETPLVLQRRARCRLSFALLAGLVVLAGAAFPVCAQYRFDHWTTEHGLPQNSINAITQTRDGYLWLATNEGLARFDGVRFTVFKRGNTPGFENNRLISLYEDRHGTLWIGSEEAVLIRYQAGRFTSYTTQNGLPSDQITHIEEDETGNLWLTGRERTLTKYRDGRFHVYYPPDCLPGVIAPYEERKHLWWSQDDRGLHLYTRGRLLSLTEQDGLPSLKINSVEVDQYGTIWIGTQGGLARVKDGRLTVIPLGNHLPPTHIGGPFLEDSRGNLWLLAANYPERFKDGLRTAYRDVSGLSGAGYEDREGTLWIGTLEGLYRARPLPVYTLTEAPRDRSVTLNVYSVLEDRAGNVWLGKWGGGLSRYREDRFTHYVSGEEWRRMFWEKPDGQPRKFVYTEGLFSSKVTALYEDRAGVLWVGTLGGVSRLKDGRPTRFSDQHGLAETWAIQQDRAGDFWFATTSGLVKLHEGGFTVYTTKDGLPDDECHALLEDRQGTLWIGTYGGLARWEQGRFSAWTERDGLAGQQIRSLYEDAPGALWLGTYDGGLTRFKDGRLTPYTTKNGLFNDGVSQILDDERGYFWLSCNRGIFRVNQAELNALAEGKVKSFTSTVFGKDDGMLAAECNGGRQPGGWRLHNGELWFPTMEGVAIIDPATIRINPLPPPVVIEECRLDGVPVACGEELHIEPGQVNLEIQYTANSFIKTEQVRFKHRLAAAVADNDWVEAGTQRTAKYSRVATGAYTFSVRAANSDGVWNTEGRSLKIVVEPHWWETWWFWSLTFLGVVGIVGLSYRQHVNRRQRQLAEELAVARRLVDSQEQERKRIAAEMHDSLGQLLLVIKNRAQLGAQSTAAGEAARVQFDEINNSATQALGEVREIAYNLRPYHLDRHGLTASLEEMIEKVAAAAALPFTTEIANIDGLFPPDAEIIVYRIVQESVTNIVKHAQATAAEIELTRDAHAVYLTVRDNGRGFDAAEREAAPPARGVGLSGIRERVRLLGGEHKITSVPGRGTTINIIFDLPPRAPQEASDGS